MVARWNFREKERMEKDQEAKRAAGIAPSVVLTEEEIVAKLQAEYNVYLEEEMAFLRELGIAEEENLR